MMSFSQISRISQAMVRDRGKTDRGFDLANALQRSWGSVAICCGEMKQPPESGKIFEIISHLGELRLLHEVFAKDGADEARKIRCMRLYLMHHARNAKKCRNLTRKKADTRKR